MNKKIAFQDHIPNNNCFGCGPNNSQGLLLKSYWVKENESICHFRPSSHHSAGPTNILNGGIIATIIDCHCVCTAIAKGYQLAGRDIGSGEPIWFVTGKLEVYFKKPVAIDKEVTLIASIVMAKEKRISLTCKLYSEGEVCSEGNVLAVRVSNTWFE